MARESKIVQVGEFESTTTVVRISDPCYKKDTWCAGTVENCLAGTYTAAVKRENHGEWGWRNVALAAHQNASANATFAMKDFKYLDDFELSENEESFWVSRDWEKLDVVVGVDSGQCGIFDDTKYGRNDIFIRFPPAECDFGDEEWYNQCCTQTLHTGNKAGVIPFGVVSESGFGDGSYNAYCHRASNGAVDGIVIVFY